MKPIQLLLVAFALMIFGAYFSTSARTALKDRLLVVLFAVAFMGSVIFPQITSWLATLVGVGRGTDLTFYIFSVAAVFAIFILHGKLQSAEQKITELARIIAIKDVEGKQ